MFAVPLFIDSKLEFRALLNCVLRDGDVVGTDDVGRTALLLMLDPWALDRLLAFDPDARRPRGCGRRAGAEERDGLATVLAELGLAEPDRAVLSPS